MLAYQEEKTLFFNFFRMLTHKNSKLLNFFDIGIMLNLKKIFSLRISAAFFHPKNYHLF